jgi:hypothetical protein
MTLTEARVVYVSVQSRFTGYVPFIVAWNMLPRVITHVVVVASPFPSNVSPPAPANGPAWRGGTAAVKNPVPVLVYGKVPVSVALEHPLSAA